MMDPIDCGTLHTVESAANYGFHHGYGYCKRSSRLSPDALVNNPRDHQWVRYRARGRRARSLAAIVMGELSPVPLGRRRSPPGERHRPTVRTTRKAGFRYGHFCT